jgi:predicted aminopeptidase
MINLIETCRQDSALISTSLSGEYQQSVAGHVPIVANKGNVDAIMNSFDADFSSERLADDLTLIPDFEI